MKKKIILEVNRLEKSEVVQLLSILDKYYNHKFNFPVEDDDENALMIETWHDYLGDYDYHPASVVLKKLMIEKEWPPTPGDLIRGIQKAMTRDEPVMKISGPKAWNMVLNAISKHSWVYNPKEVKEALPEPVLKAAEVTGFSLINNNADDSFIMNRFIKTYEQIQEHEKERMLLPGGIRKDIERIERPEVKQLAERISDNNE
jgi:hypothetical protein